MPVKNAVPEGYKLERLNTARHCRKEFCCGKDPLDRFLRSEAGQAQGKYVSATHVLTQNGVAAANGLNPVVGYVTLVSMEIALAECPTGIKKVSNKARLPAMLLARMGVDKKHKGKKLGLCLLKHAIVSAWQMNQNSGCLVLVVDPKDDDAKAFYLKYGFKSMADNPMRLFMSMGTIEELN